MVTPARPCAARVAAGERHAVTMHMGQGGIAPDDHLTEDRQPRRRQHRPREPRGAPADHQDPAPDRCLLRRAQATVLELLHAIIFDTPPARAISAA